MASLLRNWLATTVMQHVEQAITWKTERRDRRRSQKIKREPTFDDSGADESDEIDDGVFSEKNNILTIRVSSGPSGSNRWVQIVQVCVLELNSRSMRLISSRS